MHVIGMAFRINCVYYWHAKSEIVGLRNKNGKDGSEAKIDRPQCDYGQEYCQKEHNRLGYKYACQEIPVDLREI